MATSILQDELPVDSVSAADLSILFTTGSALSTAMTQVCEVYRPSVGDVEGEAADEAATASFEERSLKIRQRFVALAKRYWDSLPSSSTGGTVTDSLHAYEAAENLVDIIWTVEQAFENGVHAPKPVVQPATGPTDTTQQQQQQKPVNKAAEKLGLLVKELNSTGILSTEFLKQRLDVPLLQLAGLLTPAGGTLFIRTEARTKTAMLYKQQKFNLLREESEGYSKLEVELLSSMGSPHSNRTAQPSEPMSSVRKRAETTLENIKGLIGYFDLDPARALDVILDVFADNILYHHVFFRELLQMSPWAPKTRHEPAAPSDGTSGLLPDGSFETVQDGANTVCAQILGFKFAWYTTPEGSAETPSEKLYLLAAILIWEGLVDLPSLWPHLPPTSDDDFNKLKDKYREEISDRIAAARSNALSMAGMLTDDSEPPPPPSRTASTLTIAGAASGGQPAATVTAAASTAAATPAIPSEPPNVRLGLLRSLLSIGAFKPAFWILSTYSWICEPVPEIADLLLRILNYSISPYYYSSVSPFAHKKVDVEQKKESLCQPRQRYSLQEKKIVPASSSSYVITGRPIDVARTHSGHWREPIYFFSEWQDRLPACRTSEEVLEVVGPMLKLVGVHAGRNREFFVHLLRIAKQETLPNAAHRAAWEGIVRMHLIPALALSEPNPSTKHELWEVLRNFTYTARFAMYGEWKDRLYKRMPELRVKRVEVERDAKGLLKRLSSDNVKQFGRSLAKIAHTNPCVLFEIALNQVQSYDNLINPVVESARYLTPFGYDVLAYSLLDALSNPEKERTKSDGTNISLWLQGLATFAGTLCKRWNMEVSYILQYILNQLRGGNSKDLVVLRELITKMAGIEPVSDLSDNQIVALGGGPALQAEALHPTTAVERKGVTKRSTLRLKTALLENHLVGPLLVAVARARQECILGLDDAPLKYLGNLFDQCQQVLFQFHDFLLSQLRAEAYGKALPSLQDLWESYGLDAGIAFHVTRPALQVAIQVFDKARMERLREELKASRAAKAEAEKIAKTESKDIVMDGTNVPSEDVKPQIAINGSLPADDEELKPGEGILRSATPSPAKTKSPWHPVLADAIELAARNLPEEMQPYMTPGFFVTFWQLSLYDILIPMERYQNEVDRLNGIVREIDAALRATVPTYPGQLIDKAGEAEKKKARDRCMQTIQDLNAELKAHTEAYEATRKRLSAEKAHWFMPQLGHLNAKEGTNARRAVVRHFFQECLLPRAKLSPIDATYCARFLRVMHNVGAVNFPSLHVYDRIFSEEVSPIVFSCTEGEARNYARFLHDCLSDLSVWYNNDAIYEKQAIGNNLPGFQRLWGVRTPTETIPDDAKLQHSQFKTITIKWHKKLCEAFIACIESKDYMGIRNSILVLTKIAKFFPLFTSQGNQMEEIITAFMSSEKREDLRVLGLGYSALLKKQSSTWISLKGGHAPTTTMAAQPAAVKAASPAPVTVAPSASQSSSTSLPTGPRGATANASPARSLPSRPAEADRERRRPELSRDPELPSSTRPSESRKNSELAVPTTNGARTPHALPARPSLEGQRRDSTQNARQARNDASPAHSRTSTPVAHRGADDMQIDEPARPSREDRFARPAAPTVESRTSSSRPASPRRREPESPRYTARDPQESPRDERRSARDDAERPTRRSRAGSDGSSHSSQRDRKERSARDKDRSERKEREHRSERSDRDRDRDRRSDRDREKERDREADKTRRDKDRTREKEPPREREPSVRDKDSREKESRRSSRDKDSTRESGREKDLSREKDTSRDSESTRDRDRERRHREPSSRSNDDKRDKERNRERDSRRGDADRRVEGSSSRTAESTASRDKEVSSTKEAENTTSARDEARSGTRAEQADANSSSQLKRAAESSTSLNDLRNGEDRLNDHDQKRRRTDEPSVPSGPRADRQAPPPISSLPSRPSETSIKGRASPREASAGQGLRIKSAASAALALSSAQQHNARLQRTSGSETPKTPDIQAEASPQPRPPTVNEERPQGLLGRLGGPAPARPNNERRESSNEARERSNRRPTRGR